MIRNIYVVVDEVDDDPMEWTAEKSPRGAWLAFKENCFDGPEKGETHRGWTIRKRKEGYKVVQFKPCTKEGKGDE